MYSSCFDGCCSTHPYCPFPGWIHPLQCNPAHYCCASQTDGPTLIIHGILLEPCGNQSCTPRALRVRITGPSYPGGEVFTLRVGSCTEIDEPLVIANLTPGTYTIEQLAPMGEYDVSFTGPICGGSVTITCSVVPTVITIVCRKRLRPGCCHPCRPGCGTVCPPACGGTVCPPTCGGTVCPPTCGGTTQPCGVVCGCFVQPCCTSSAC